jgi:predicted nucleic acid-binding protein
MVSPHTSKVTKVFVDSSVLIAAAISPKGSARNLLVQGFRGQLILCRSTFVLVETERNLQKKRPVALPTFESFRVTLASALVDPSAEFVHQLLSTVQPKDAPIVAAALYAQAV